MNNDEQAIRDLIATWHSATAKSDLESLRSLMAEDVVFLVAGKPPMRGRDDFAAGFKQASEKFDIESSSNIQEIHVNGEWAYLWNYLVVVMTPKNGGAPLRRTGNVLSVLRKENGAWVMFRDANLLTDSE
jgi:uncharacterized protein (TIGR02246 family)